MNEMQPFIHPHHFAPKPFATRMFEESPIDHVEGFFQVKFDDYTYLFPFFPFAY